MGVAARRSILALALLIIALANPVAADNFSSAYISEIMAGAQGTLADDKPEHTGWIEICNGGAATIDLDGWYLTDSADKLTKWRFPRVSLPPDASLVVFASGKDRTGDVTRLETSFRLNASGGYLALVNPAKKVVSELAPYPKQAPGTSYGSVPGEPSTRGHFARPTPGKPNMTHGPGFAPEVAFSQSSGTFTDPITLKLSVADAAATIHFTLDGQLPTSRSPVYSAPLAISRTTQVRTRAYRDGMLPGPPRSESFILLRDDLRRFTSNLPVLLMHTLGDRAMPPRRRYSFVYFSLFEPVNGKTTLTSAPACATRGSYRIRGSTSAALPQHAYALHLLDEFDNEHRRPLLGLPADSDWVLYAPTVYEPVMIHNPFIYQLSRDMGLYSPRTRFLEVFLVDGAGSVESIDYQGIYVLEEKIGIGSHRVNIHHLGADDLAPPQVRGGYILKLDRLGPGEAGLAAAGVQMAFVDPGESKLSLPQRAPQRKYLQQYFAGFERALYGPKWKDPDVGYRAYVDVDEWIDYHVLEVLSGNVDALGLSTYFQVRRDGKIAFGPHWDFDRALGSTDGRDENPRNWNTGGYFGAPWWNRLFTDPDFWQRWVDRWQELRQTHFSLASMNALIDRLAGELRQAQPRQTARWRVPLRGGSYQSEVGLMKQWLASRVDFIDAQLCQRPVLSHQGGAVPPGTMLTLTAPAGAKVYYTTDGSDPRLSGGGISPKAIVYSAPIPVTDKLRIVARAQDPARRQVGGPPISTPWSGRIEAAFTLSAH